MLICYRKCVLYTISFCTTGQVCREPEHVLVLGTGHVAQRSPADARRTVRAVRPQGVVLELCRERTAILRPEVVAFLSRGQDLPGGAAAHLNCARAGMHPGRLVQALHPLQVASAMLSLVVRRLAPHGTVPGLEFHWASQVRHLLCLHALLMPSVTQKCRTDTQHEDALPCTTCSYDHALALLYNRTIAHHFGPRKLPACPTLHRGSCDATRHLFRHCEALQQVQQHMALSSKKEHMQAAKEVGAEVILGDRPMSVTLQRAWAAISLADCIGLLKELLPIVLLLPGATERMQQKFIAENAKPHDGQQKPVPESAAANVAHSSAAALTQGEQWQAAVDSMLLRPDDDSVASPAGPGSSFQEPLLHERDRYLAWSLRRSQAVSGKHVVVGIVGKGHLQGILPCLIDSERSVLRFQDVAGKRLPPLAGGKGAAALRALLPLSCIVVGVVGAYIALQQAHAWP